MYVFVITLRNKYINTNRYDKQMLTVKMIWEHEPEL